MKTIGILAPLRSKWLRLTFDALGEVLDVRFEERAFRDDTAIDAWFLHEADYETLRRIAHSNRPSYAVIRDDQWITCGESSAIEFSNHAALPSVLSGRRIRSDEAIKLMALPRQPENMTVLASKAGAPIWAIEKIRAALSYFCFVTQKKKSLNRQCRYLSMQRTLGSFAFGPWCEDNSQKHRTGWHRGSDGFSLFRSSRTKLKH